MKTMKPWFSLLAVLPLLLAAIVSPPAAEARDYAYSPVKGHLTSQFGWRKDPYSGKRRFHAGVDIAAGHGDAIHVPQAGTVEYSGPYKGYGNVVIVRHAPHLRTLYGHASQVLVQPGQPVRPGQVIARVGSTGRSTGPHLHFEVRQNDGFVNPLQYLGFLESHGDVRLARMAPLPQQPPVYSSHPAYPSAVGGPETPNAQLQSAPVPVLDVRHYRGRPGHAVQVIQGSQVQTMHF